MSEQLVEAPKKRLGLFAVVGVVVVVLVAGIVFAVTRGGAEEKAVRIGVVGAGDPYWSAYVKAAGDQGIKVEVVDFTDYAQPNPALAEGEIDLNQFQHIVYLADYNVSNKKDLVPVGATAIYPLGLYSKKYPSAAEVPAGATVAVPNDASNQGRGLLVLQAAGLVKLKSGGTIFSDLTDVDEAASKVKVTALDAALTATSLDDLAAAIINNDFVEKAGLSFDKAIAKDDPADPKAVPYVNVFAAREQDKDNPTYTKLVEIYQNSREVLDGVKEVSGGTAVFAKTPAGDLRKSLDDVEKITAERK
ncbi:MetQ/NlpA family ABC transporter substrate-binding protein [Umezawaea tangerina]|uniref:D-methionine transport system substrate-binding protein n=1 Tax=Umezawaea tangerina TaxID=84725 RepID=A0A2T0T2A1_9PSEU|nr:MetQ/NlpA family ABC transporter substrate-binding protein [Umezawaea tangerina]PRY39763.1 D-methionine transport system substrate-binding protein [Umezawaea tangerina]